MAKTSELAHGIHLDIRASQQLVLAKCTANRIVAKCQLSIVGCSRWSRKYFEMIFSIKFALDIDETTWDESRIHSLLSVPFVPAQSFAIILDWTLLKWRLLCVESLVLNSKRKYLISAHTHNTHTHQMLPIAFASQWYRRRVSRWPWNSSRLI